MPHHYSEKEQVLILRLVRYFERERDAGKPLLNLAAVQERVADALGVSQATVSKICAKGVETDADYTGRMSAASLEWHGRPLHEVHEHAIRARIYQMYSTGAHVTLVHLQRNLIEHDDVRLSISSLDQILKKLKFKWRKCTLSNRKYLMEMPYVAAKRLSFLREFKKNETDPYSLRPVFLDETWIYSKGGFRKSWQDDTLKTVRKKSGEGVRYIILHAGSRDGFVKNASLIFKSGSKAGDYHDCMNTINFENWFKNQLIANLEEPSLIIMDNASYHSELQEKIPNSSWRKASLIQWLEERQIPYPHLGMKDELLNIIKQKQPKKEYRLDTIALENGHRVLRLPPYHCQFNPIEMVWHECKVYYDSNITAVVDNITHDVVINTWQEAINRVTSQKWEKYVGHVQKLIDSAWETEKLIDASNIPPLIINPYDSDDSDDSDDYGMSENENID